MSWILMSDEAYAIVASMADRDGLSVDAYVARQFADMRISIPYDGRPFHVYRPSDFKQLDATKGLT